MDKFDWPQVRAYYEARNARWAATGREDDPEAFVEVVAGGGPLWFARRLARSQGLVYRSLFDLVPPARPAATALDVGCGAGRWAPLLSARGYRPVGIDLQPDLIRAARRLHPQGTFLNVSVQDYVPEGPFDLVSSVEVLQHNPPEQQRGVIRKLRDCLIPGGHAIVLEGTGNDPRPQAFYRPVADWIDVFERSGFRVVATRRYYYHLALRASTRLASVLAARGPNGDGPPRDSDPGPGEEAATPRPKRGRLRRFAFRAVVEIEAPIESMLTRTNVALPHANCGFLFRAV